MTCEKSLFLPVYLDFLSARAKESEKLQHTLNVFAKRIAYTVAAQKELVQFGGSGKKTSFPCNISIQELWHAVSMKLKQKPPTIKQT